LFANNVIQRWHREEAQAIQERAYFGNRKTKAELERERLKKERIAAFLAAQAGKNAGERGEEDEEEEDEAFDASQFSSVGSEGGRNNNKL
jgi:hypothetical protein